MGYHKMAQLFQVKTRTCSASKISAKQNAFSFNFIKYVLRIFFYTKLTSTSLKSDIFVLCGQLAVNLNIHKLNIHLLITFLKVVLNSLRQLLSFVFCFVFINRQIGLMPTFNTKVFMLNKLHTVYSSEYVLVMILSYYNTKFQICIRKTY